MDDNQAKIDVDELMKMIHLQINQQVDSANKSDSMTLNKLAQKKLLLSQVKKILKIAQDRSIIRQKWPDKLSRFPFNITLVFKPIILKALAALFKDQREINLSLISALKLSLEVNEQLLQEIENIKAKLEHNG
jgi:O-antigen chain-terminating methyltransferase